MSQARPLGKRESFGAAFTFATINVVVLAHDSRAGWFFSLLPLVLAVLLIAAYFATRPRPFRRSALILFVVSMIGLALANLGIWGEAIAGA